MVGYYDPQEEMERCDACKMPAASLLTITDDGTLTLCADCICNAHTFAGFPGWTPTMLRQREHHLNNMEVEYYDSQRLT